MLPWYKLLLKPIELNSSIMYKKYYFSHTVQFDFEGLSNFYLYLDVLSLTTQYAHCTCLY